MHESSKSLLFPDVNVWLAMTVSAHEHHRIAVGWFDALEGSSRVCFCRITQMSLLRLLTTEAVMGRDEVLTQLQAWRAYDELLADERVRWFSEPSGLDREFRSRSTHDRPAPKDWTDAYLAAFASAADLTLVSFDQGFRAKVRHVQILSA
jgi:hypothetical protein